MATKLRILRGLTESRSYNTDAELSKGIGVQEKAADPTIIEAGGNNTIGFLLQEVTTEGPSFMEQNAGIPLDEVPVGHRVTVRGGEGEIVTNQESNLSGASINDDLGINAGLWRIAQSTDRVRGRLLEKNFNGVTGDYRIEVVRTARDIA
jgi:hypothetical protein